MVGIDPNAQVRKVAVGRVDDAIAIAVECAQLGEAIGRCIAEDFRDVIDAPIAISVKGQDTVIRRNPTGPFGKAVAIQVKGRVAVGPGGEFNAIAVQIKNERRNVGCGDRKIISDVGHVTVHVNLE